MFAEDLRVAKARHAPDAAFEPESVARHLIAVLEGGLILAKADGGPDAAAESLRHYKLYLRSLFEGRPARARRGRAA